MCVKRSDYNVVAQRKKKMNIPFIFIQLLSYSKMCSSEWRSESRIVTDDDDDVKRENISQLDFVYSRWSNAWSKNQFIGHFTPSVIDSHRRDRGDDCLIVSCQFMMDNSSHWSISNLFSRLTFLLRSTRIRHNSFALLSDGSCLIRCTYLEKKERDSFIF